ncbi:autotransporter domain-containing protein, partial [Klebsiella pneumoniae]
SGRVNGGYDFEFSKLQTGPIFGFDFTHYRVNAFNDHEDLRTAVYYQEQNVNSFEVSLGWKVTSSLSLGLQRRSLSSSAAGVGGTVPFG